ncbi:dTDP-4-amino-4,6-dideoxygalactose transaminase [uncultured Ferrimonas sp.]|uniref:dTDP-4-amino-4,6-dideoxygalactose transaminase n=1 Tax=uncultured Ferrimonas sp. TaxID=432640 RepID=UPI0026343FA9|nr:dTDP-4-amino-4,6-dideoxygalactose transaminase [uncultured Ferrimonas sp.]
MIHFNKSPVTGNELSYMTDVINSKNMIGDGYYTKWCEAWFEKHLNTHKALLTPSCTAALEMAALLADLQPGDEVIVPSYTFVTSASAFALHGAKLVFVDIDPATMNMDVSCVENAITERTKVIVPVHYAGVACDMDRLMILSKKYNLLVVEDAAQGVMSTYKGKALGTIGHLGCFSFHGTKNYTSGGEGGALLINDVKLIDRAEVIREKGTNRSQFFRGQVDKYTWRDIGSSFLMSELQAAYLKAQLENAGKINTKRLALWQRYAENLTGLEQKGLIELPVIPSSCEHNAHMFFVKVQGVEERGELIGYLKREKITAVFHYIPLHSSPAGIEHGCFNGEDKYTTAESERLLRLPLYYDLTIEEVDQVCSSIWKFYS